MRRGTLGLLAVALFGCSDGKDGTSEAVNQPPSEPRIQIGPDDPGTSDDLVAYVLDESIDPDGDDVTYRFRWFLDGVEQDDLDEERVPAERTQKGEEWKVSVSASDGDLSSTADDDRVTILDTPPQIELTLSPSLPDTNDDLVAILEVTDPDEDDDLDWTVTWSVDGTPAAYDTLTVPASATHRGETWTIEVVADDGDEDDPVSESRDIVIRNAIPEVLSVQLTPTSATAASTLTASAVSADGDNDAVTLSYSWAVNGSVIQSGPGATLSGAFAKHEEVVVSVTASDGTDTSAPVASSPLTIANTPPSLTSAAIDPSGVYEESTLTCDTVGWADVDGDSESYTWSWTVNGTEVSTAATLDGADFDKGDQIRCIATPWDGEEEGTARTSAIRTVRNTAPSLASVALSMTSPREADTLSAVVGATSDVDGDDVDVTLEWLVNGQVVSSDETLTGALFAKGDTIAVRATPTDGTDAGTPVTSVATTAIDTAPIAHGIAITPTPAYTNTTLTAAFDAEDADGDVFQIDHVWKVNGSTVGGTGPTLAANLFERGDTVVVSASAVAGGVSTASVTSPSITIANRPPTTPVVTLGDSATTDDDLHCEVTFPSADADGDTVTYAFTWLKNGAVWTGTPGETDHPGDTVPHTATSDDQVWQCLAVATDGTDESDTAESWEITIGQVADPFECASAAFETILANQLPNVLGGDVIDVNDYSDSIGFTGSYTFKDVWAETDYVSSYVDYGTQPPEVVVDMLVRFNSPQDRFKLTYNIFFLFNGTCRGNVNWFPMQTRMPFHVSTGSGSFQVTIDDPIVTHQLEGTDFVWEAGCAVSDLETALLFFGWSAYSLVSAAAQDNLEAYVADRLVGVDSYLEDALNQECPL